MRKRIWEEIPGDIIPTTGDEIGQALVPVMEKISHSNTALIEAISRSIQSAISAVDTRPISIETNVWTRLEFKVIRDKEGELDSVIVTRI